MGPDHFRFFHAIGVNLKQIYGQTEIAGISVLHRDGDIKFDTVGKPIPETEVKITPEGEIISKSPSVFRDITRCRRRRSRHCEMDGSIPEIPGLSTRTAIWSSLTGPKTS